jgi:hypothetical protein
VSLVHFAAFQDSEVHAFGRKGQERKGAPRGARCRRFPSTATARVVRFSTSSFTLSVQAGGLVAKSAVSKTAGLHFREGQRPKEFDRCLCKQTGRFFEGGTLQSWWARRFSLELHGVFLLQVVR